MAGTTTQPDLAPTSTTAPPADGLRPLYYSGDLITGTTLGQLYQRLGFGHVTHVNKHSFAPGPFSASWRADPEYLMGRLGAANAQWGYGSAPDDGLYIIDIEFDAAWAWYRRPNDVLDESIAENGYQIIRSCIDALEECRPMAHRDLFNVSSWLDPSPAANYPYLARARLVERLQRRCHSLSIPLWRDGRAQFADQAANVAVLTPRVARAFEAGTLLTQPVGCWFWRMYQGGNGGLVPTGVMRPWLEHWLAPTYGWGNGFLFGGHVQVPHNEYIAKCMRHYT